MLRRALELPPSIDEDMFTYYRKFQNGEFIIVFVDTAGEGSDNNAGQFLSKDRLDIPLVMHYKGSIVDVTPKLKTTLEWIAHETGVPPCVAYETNNGGGYELERLSRLNIKHLYVIYCQYVLNAQNKLVKTDKIGWNTNTATRPAMLKGVQDLVNNRLVKIYDPNTITEMFSFVKHQMPSGWKAEAEVGSFDDLIMSLAGVWQLYQTEEPTQSYDQLMQQVPKDDVPQEMQRFGVGMSTNTIQPNSLNPLGRSSNPFYTNDDEQLFDSRGNYK
jgi:hypothetical protein